MSNTKTAAGADTNAADTKTGQPVRSVTYEALLSSGRAARIRRRPSGIWLEVQLAGEQNSDGSRRSYVVGFTNKGSARKAQLSLAHMLRRLEAQGQINTDLRYNKIIRMWAEAAERQIGTNRRSADASIEDGPSLVDILRGPDAATTRTTQTTQSREDE